MPSNYKLFYERNLPHYQPPGATLFITFRLAGSLPRDVIEQLEAEQHDKEKEIKTITTLPERNKAAILFQKSLFNKLDKELDGACHGPKWLADPRIAELVCSSFHYLDGTDYVLEAYCLMPNHVHLVCTPLINNDKVVSISRIMQSLKGFAAHRANQLLGRKGEFWQHESYDHVV